MRYLLLFIAVSFASIVEARYCNNPNCAMCNRIFGPMGGIRSYNSAPVQVQTFAPQPIFAPAPQPTIVPAQPSVPQTIPQEILYSLDPSAQVSVEKMLAILAPTSNDVLYDLGSGDGRILITASNRYGTSGVGIEINAESASLSMQRIHDQGIDNVRIVTGDATKYDLSDATLVTMYLYPPVIKALVPNLQALKSGTRVVSFAHSIPLPGTRKIDVGEDSFYLWIKP